MVEVKIFAFILLLLLQYANGACPATETDSTLYNSVCVQPAQVYYEVDLNWVEESNMKGAWNFELGNDVARLHLADILKGEHLPDDFNDYEKICARGRYDQFSPFYINGTSSGYDNNTAHWECIGIEEEIGAFNCEFSSDLHKYIEKVKFYPSYADNKNFFVMVTCYPSEKKAGWFTHSINSPLTDEEKTEIANHVKQLGFDGQLLPMFGPQCL